MSDNTEEYTRCDLFLELDKLSLVKKLFCFTELYPVYFDPCEVEGMHATLENIIDRIDTIVRYLLGD